MQAHWIAVLFALALAASLARAEEGHCTQEGGCTESSSTATAAGSYKGRRYLLYTINPGEGFNLARDVYIRAASLARELSKESPWTLVLPPFGSPHWRHEHWVPWSKVFDVEALKQYVDVMELGEFLERFPEKPQIQHVMHLKSFFPKDGNWTFLMRKVDECDFGNYPGTHYESKGGQWHGVFWGKGPSVTAGQLTCYEALGDSHTAVATLRADPHERVMLARIETLMHHGFGGAEYWKIRHSMHFAQDLKSEAERFMRDVIKEPYVAIHLRRGDFLYAHRKTTPSIDSVVKQVRRAMAARGLKTLFIATDARKDDADFAAMDTSGFKVFRYPGGEGLQNAQGKFTEAQVAIIDQWICANAAFFMGTSESTFTFRIHEERDRLRKDLATTYEDLCPETVENGVLGFHCEVKQRWPPIFS